MLYSSGFSTSYEELISRYPLFYRDVLEMRAILEAEGRALDSAVNNINLVLDNAFLFTADESAIARLEAFLRINPDDNATLEERRNALWLYYTGFGKMSASKLKELLFPYTGEDCSISFSAADEARNNLLRIVMPRGTTERLSELDIMCLLARRLPAHIWYGVEVVYSEKSNLFFGIATTYINEMILPSEPEDVSAIAYFVDELGDVLIDELGTILTD